jgi:hypothetical protein
MEKSLVALIGVVVFAVWVGAAVWIVKRFRRTFEQLKSGQLKVPQGQIGRSSPSGKPSPWPAASEAPKFSPMGVVTETLEESLAKHRKQVDQALAALFKRQS